MVFLLCVILAVICLVVLCRSLFVLLVFFPLGHCIVCPFVFFFLLVIVLSVHLSFFLSVIVLSVLRFTGSDDPFGIFKHFLILK